MTTKSPYNELLTIGKATAENKAWTKYAEYCFDRDKGLRKEAFVHLNEFLKSTESWTEDDKIKFVSFLSPFYESDRYCPFPYPLSEKLIKPTLEKWCLKEMADSRPFRWYGKFYYAYEYFEKALKINPQDEQARLVLLKKRMYYLWYSVHELPDGYLGEPKEDLLLIDELKVEIAKLTDIKMQQLWTNTLENYTELVKNYIEWKKSGYSDLGKWGEANHKRVSLGVRTYYYDK